jgi:hypothetical protein
MIYIYVYIYVYIYIYMYMYICIYIHDDTKMHLGAFLYADAQAHSTTRTSGTRCSTRKLSATRVPPEPRASFGPPIPPSCEHLTITKLKNWIPSESMRGAWRAASSRPPCRGASAPLGARDVGRCLVPAVSDCGNEVPGVRVGLGARELADG